MSHLAIIAVLSGLGGCAHAPSTPAPVPAPQAMPPVAVVVDEPVEVDTPSPAQMMVAEAGPNTTVLVIEADDLGGAPDAVVAPPKRPSMPSMMSGIAMAPSR